jgi:hypothetical protein
MWQNEDFDYIEDFDSVTDYEYAVFKPVVMNRIRDRKISLLTNSDRYALDSVYIMKEDKKYKLVVINNREVLTEKYYKTLKVCKNVFSNSYSDKQERKELTPQWSDFW